METTSRKLVSLLDYEYVACPYDGPHTNDKTGVKCGNGILPKFVIGYYSGGAGDEFTLSRNRTAFEQIFFKPRYLRYVETVNLETRLLSNIYKGPDGRNGLPVALPIGIAPAAFHMLAHPMGEKATAQAAKEIGTCLCLSTFSNTSLEEVAENNSSGLMFFQLYVFKDRSVTRDLLRRAEQAGYKAVVLTIDAPGGIGQREADTRLCFNLPAHLSVANLTDSLKRLGGDGKSSAFQHYASTQFDGTLTWECIAWLKSETTLPIIVKGIMCAEDAILAIKHGVAAIWISNHGGRQLDGVLSTIEVLPQIAQAVEGTGVEVYIDGGFIRGTDVLKALALGANFVFIARPVLWGLAVDGKNGVVNVFNILRKELIQALQLSGCAGIQNASPDLIIADRPVNAPAPVSRM